MEDYDLKPTELRLLHHLCLETFDAGVVSGRVNLSAWAVKMRMRDANGIRVDKCEKVFHSVVELGMVDHNATQGTFELRPDPLTWSRVRPFYGDKGNQELELRAERPLSESLSELSREKAREGVPEPPRDWHALFSGMNAAVQAGPDAVEKFKGEHPELFSAEKSAEVRRKNPPSGPASLAELLNPQSSQVFAADWSPGQGASAEKSAEAIASLAGTVQKAELATARSVSAEKSAGGSATGHEAENKTAEALKWVNSVDSLGQLLDPVYGPQWKRLCLEYPDYVLTRLKRTLEARRKYGQVDDPLAYLSRKAREEGRMRR